MRFNLPGRSKGVCFKATISIFFLLLSFPLLAEIGIHISSSQTPLVPLLSPSRSFVFSLDTTVFNREIKYPRTFVRKINIDSTGQYITISQRLKEFDVLPTLRLSFNDYLTRRAQQETMRQWKTFVRTHVTSSSSSARGRRGIKIETPKIKSKAFRRMFGGETMSLNVSGQITIDGGMRNEKRSQVKTALSRGSNTNFQMKQTQRFNVEGKIGEFVSVYVDQDSERPFEFDNAIKLEYTSDEDGIVQKIQAGNVALNLPGTRFVTFSSRSSGLFGIKSQFKVGSLDITAIASMEKGEKNNLSISGGKEKKESQLKITNYRRFTYFFIDSLYRQDFLIFNDEGNHISKRKITEIKVYKSDNGYENKNGFPAWAVLDPSDSTKSDTTGLVPFNYKGYFLQLEPNSDYFIHTDLGYIAMNMPLSENEVLAVTFRVVGFGEKDTLQYGTIRNIDLLADTTVIQEIPIFKIIKPQKPRPSDKTWDLEWKNVYDLGGRNIEEDGFELKIYWDEASGNDLESMQNEAGETISFLQIFGLDERDKNGAKNPDNIIDINDNILNLARGELIFPDLRPFDPVDPSRRALLENGNRICEIYDTTSTDFLEQQNKFYIWVKSTSTSTNYSLGLNVIEGTEEILLNGTKLQKDVDYLIDYFSGQLTLLNPDATSPDANLDINYERQQLFSVDKKSLMGARAEYKLWERGNNKSFIGGTFLYLNQKTLDQRVRVGSEPMRNLVWDLNTSINFEPKFITKAIETIPFIHSTDPSRITFEGEIAQIVPNPNTLNNKKTGDNNGVAYLDDFEGARRQTPLGILRTNWGPCSPPTSDPDSASNEYMLNRGHLYWYNPYEQVRIQEIWPNREVTTNMGGATRTNVLTLNFTANPNTSNIEKSWNGIQQSLSAGYADQSEMKFLEIWIKGNNGRLNIDFGQISEDVIPNRKLDTEDKRKEGYRNKLLDNDEDTGIDGIYGDDPPNPFFNYTGLDSIETENGDRTGIPYDFWDINDNGIKDQNEPWSSDDWDYKSASNVYTDINGTEGSRNDGIAIYPNSEDMNGNGDVDFRNDFYRFSFSLKKTDPDSGAYIKGGSGKIDGWYLYRIPLEDYVKKVGDPNWDRIEYVRLWMNGAEGNESIEISIAEINLVGNDWKFEGLFMQDSTTAIVDSSSQIPVMNIAVVNTHDNPKYTPPPGVEGVIDPIQKIRSKEQSLVIQINNLESGVSSLAKKTFFNNQNLINYKTLKMFVHGGDISNQLTPGDSIEFFMRLGSGTSNENYYEIRLPVYDSWDKKNNIEVNFEEFMRAKSEMDVMPGDTNQVLLPNGHLLTVSNRPSLTQIKWLIIGIKNLNPNIPFSGEVWINELRVSNVRKDKGTAMRVRGEINLSNFIIVDGDYERKDADFHTINESFGKGQNSKTMRMNAKINIDKVLPTSLGLSIPIKASYSKSEQTPKFLPGSDILVKSVTNDSVFKASQSFKEQKGLTFSFSKRSKSRNFILRYLIDPISGRLNYNNNYSRSSSILYSNEERYEGSFKYNLNFGTQTYIEPFKWIGSKRLLKWISETKFYYLPTKLQFDISCSSSNKDSETRERLPTKSNIESMTRKFSTGYKPLQFISSDYSRNWKFDMRNSEWSELFSSLSPGDLISTSQSFSFDFKPKIFNWLTHNIKYNAQYQFSDKIEMRESGTSRSSSINKTITFSGNFDPNKFVKSFNKRGSSRSRSKGRSRSNLRKPRTQKEESKNNKKEKKQKKPFPWKKIFSIPGNLLSKIDPISISVNQGETSNDKAILGTPSLYYQFGFSSKPGVSHSENLTSEPRSKNDKMRITLKSGIKISAKINIKLDYSLNRSTTYSTQMTGTTTQSALLLKDNNIPFPNWSLSWRGLEKLPFISKYFKTASLTHSFSGKKTETWNETKTNITQEQVSTDFRPLLGLTLAFNNGISANIQYTSSVQLQTNNNSGGSQQKTIKSNISITAKYSKRGGFRLPFLKGKLDNNINFSLTFNNSVNKNESRKNKDSKFAEMSFTKSWTFKPSVKYSFTSNVSGGAYIELGGREDKRMGKTKISAFGINAIISLGGR
jgi:cell surface protein SprA